MSAITKLFLEELQERFDWCTSGRGSPADLDIDKAFTELGEEALLAAIVKGKAIKECALCGKLFVARDRRERYCSNLREDGKRCKDVGAAKTRNDDPVTAEFDRARRLHLYRRSSAGKTDDAEARYQSWLRFAKRKETECRKGKISLEEFGNAIGKEYAKDKAKKRS